MRRALAMLPVCFAATALAFGSCDLYPESLLAPPPVDPNRPADGTGVGWWSKADEAGCFSAGTPDFAARPNGASAAAIEPVYLAFDKVWLGAQTPDGRSDENAWRQFGLDLDGRCTLSETCPASAAAAAPPPAPGCRPSTAAVPFDGDYCRDNTLGRFSNSITANPVAGDRFRLGNDLTDCGLCLGYFSYVLRISDYNGGPDDDRVRLDIYPSAGLPAPYPLGCDSGGWRSFPCWLSTDPWQVDRAALAGEPSGPALPDSVMADDEAFVRDGYLVARWPAGATFWIPHRPGVAISAFPATMSWGFVTGRLGRGADGTWALGDGIIAGVASRDQLMGGFRRLGLCESDVLYSVVDNFVATNLDTRTDRAVDAELPCDGFSVGIGFRARQASVGAPVDVTPLKECVAPESTTLPPGVPGVPGSAPP